jgi:hypothetical protein
MRRGSIGAAWLNWMRRGSIGAAWLNRGGMDQMDEL